MTYTVKFIDYTHTDETTTFGTCDLCLHTGTATYPEFTFQITDENGNTNTITVDAYFWDWGHLYNIEIDNVISFAEWFNAQDITVEDKYNISYHQISEWVDDYYRG